MTQLRGFDRIRDSFRQGLYFGYFGAGGAFLGNLIGEFLGLNDTQSSWTAELFLVGIWNALLGAGIAAAIVVAQELRQGRTLGDPALRKRAASSLMFGGLAGMVAGIVSQFLYSVIGPSEPLRVICWAIAGGLLGIALSRRITNLSRNRGLAGGAVGGTIGAIAFIMVVSIFQTDVPARMVGSPAIGFSIGLMLVVADMLFRSAWLEVRFGPHEARTITLGETPICVGSDTAKCAVFLAGTAPIAFIYRFEEGKIFRDEPGTGRTSRVSLGVPQPLGNLTITAFGRDEPAPAPIMAHAAAAPPTANPAPATGPSYLLKLPGYSPIALNSSAGAQMFQIPGVEVAAGKAAAELRLSESNPSQATLRNLSSRQWVAYRPNTGSFPVDPGSLLTLERGVTVDFGAIKGMIA